MIAWTRPGTDAFLGPKSGQGPGVAEIGGWLSQHSQVISDNDPTYRSVNGRDADHHALNRMCD
jgi:hypothetical protein